MCPVVRIPDELFRKLEKLAVGFDTPAAVIERLINLHGNLDVSENEWNDSKQFKKPELIFYPSDEEKFRQLLLREKKAYVLLHNVSGWAELYEWNAGKFSEKSNLRGNIWSGFLRGWREKEIVKAEFFIKEENIPEEVRELARQVRMGRKIMKEHRDVLQQLAKS